MLETDEVDDDYFTPQSSTTLANIFESSLRQDEGTENETLKYTPPKAQTLPKPKVTECVFACALFAYKWTENNYEAVGKIGFALIKNIISNNLNVVLYDSNKTTLSSTTVTPEFKIIVKGNLYISFYDSIHRYWSIYATEEEINKIIDLLKNLNAAIVHSSHNESGPPEPHKIERENHSTIQSEKKEKESDTDSSLNRRTKDSILSRMANMGQSVLPRHSSIADKTDSSDTNDNDGHPKAIRHKPIKNTLKRVTSDNASEIRHPTSSYRQIMPAARSSVKTLPIYTNVDGQLVAMENTNTVSSKNDSNFNLFITEQRISNSELRINIGRISDKMDKMLDNIKELEDTDKRKVTSNFQIEILQKLLAEYENKIKTYEQIIKTNKIEANIIHQINVAEDPNDDINKIDLYEKNITKLEKVISEKNKEITNLNEEIKLIKQKHTETSAGQIKREAELCEQNVDLRQSLSLKQEELEDISARLKENLQATSSDKSCNAASKLKSVMNDTFHAISVNFENDKHYSGNTIKSTVAAVIKKVTMESLSE